MDMRRAGLPVAVIGWALFGGWPLAAFMTSALLPASPAASATVSSLFWPLSLGCVCAAMILLAIGNQHAERWIAPPRACGLCAGLLLASCAIMVAANQLPTGSAALGLGITGAALSGASSGFLHVAWQRVLMSLTWNQLDVLVPLGYGGSLAIGFAASAIPAVAGAALLFGCLIFSGIALVRAQKDGGIALVRVQKEGGAPAAFPSSASLASATASPSVSPASATATATAPATAPKLLPRTWIATALVVVALWIPIVFAEDSVVAERAMANWQFLMAVGAGIAAALLFSYGAYIYARSVGMGLIARLTVPLAVLALATLCFAPAEWLVVAYILAFTANTIMHIFLHLASISLAKRGACGIVRSTACILMPLYLASLVSSLINPALCLVSPAEVAFVTTALLLLTVAFALPYSIGYRATKAVETAANSAEAAQDVGAGEDVEATKDAGATEDAGADARPEPFDPVQSISERCKLTRREAEIFELFAAGRDSGYIREKLYISRDTVHTHLKHIYQKLGIHSKREMFDMIEHERADCSSDKS